MFGKLSFPVLALTLVGWIGQTEAQTLDPIIGNVLTIPTVKYAFCEECANPAYQAILDTARDCAINGYYPVEGAQAYAYAQTYANDSAMCAQVIYDFGWDVATEDPVTALEACLVCGAPTLLIDYSQC